MMQKSELEKHKDEIILCNECRCGFCRELCPVYNQLRQEAYSTRGKMMIAQALLDGELVPSERIAEIVEHCTNCGWCKERCPQNLFTRQNLIDTPTFMEDFRKHLQDVGFEIKPYKKISDNIKKELNPYGEPISERTREYEDLKLPATAETLYFAGCTASYRMPEILHDTIDILKATGKEFTMLGEDEGCCASTLLRTGQREEAEKLAKRQVDLFKKKGVKTIVTSCAGCYKAFKKDYPKLGYQLNVKHILEYVADLVEDGRLKFRPVKLSVTYHDPCHLGRGAEVYEAPRTLLTSVPGIELKEMYFNRNLARCCGAGGGMLSVDKELGVSIAAERMKEAKETGADVLVSPCPFCVRNLRDGAEKAGIDMPVYDLTHILKEALSLTTV